RNHHNADRSTIPQHGDEEPAPPANCAGQCLLLKLGIDVDIEYLDNGAIQDRAAGPTTPVGWSRICAMQLFEGLGAVVVMGDRMEQDAVELKERAEQSVAQFQSASDDRVKHRLRVGLRVADDAQNLSGGRLP